MITAQQKRYMQMAIDLAEQSLDEKKGGPFGAVIVRDNLILGSSGNCVFLNTDPCAHAEIMAIRDACRNVKNIDLGGAVIYSSGEPCPMCTAAIYWANIKNIYYSNTEQDALEFGFWDKIILRELKKPKQKRAVRSIRIVNKSAIRVFEKASKSL